MDDCKPCREVSTLAALVGAELHVELHHLVAGAYTRPLFGSA